MNNKTNNQQNMANAIRFLSADAIEKANSGHPGAPMGMADIAQVLWNKHLKHNPTNPNWINRDRFVLSNGHASMLIYSLLHLTGYELSIDDIKSFRKLHSKTPGHPECDITPGVETTTGPLGQGLANAVGMALTEKLLADEFNKPEHKVIDHFTYTFIGDGCLMEGISHEVCSLAGTLNLSKLIVIYDDNKISIDGNVENWFSDDTPARFLSYGWNVISNVDGHDFDEIDKAITSAKNNSSNKPTIICCSTIIGKGAPNKEGSEHVHGAPLGAEELVASKKSLNWPHEPFSIPDDIYQLWNAKDEGNKSEKSWKDTWSAYSKAYPELSFELERRANANLPQKIDDSFVDLYKTMAQQSTEQQKVATRKASQQTLDVLAQYLPELFGGSADLTASNLTNFKGSISLTPNARGNHLSYGVREFGMSAMMNGMALHGGYIPYGGTFLTFSDYSRNAVRMSALMKKRVIYVFTHDSIGLGEDGPTHQSIEHVPSLRIIPNLDVWRPCDQMETAVSWVSSIKKDDGPSAIVLSRQAVPNINLNTNRVDDIAKGGYVIQKSSEPKITIIATGTEVSIAIEAANQLAQDNINAQVVSIPSTQAFDRQSDNYKNEVINPNLPIIVVEAAQTDLWYKYINRSKSGGCVIGINDFGLSAPAQDIYAYFGITTNKVVEKAKKLIS